MGKRSFVTLYKNKRRYQIAVEDIMEVHKLTHKKRPRLPSYECVTADEIASGPAD